MKSIFEQYKKDLNSILARNIDVNEEYKKVSTKLKSRPDASESYFSKGILNEFSDQKIQMEYNNDIVNSLFGKNRDAFPCISIGGHPDFSHLDFGDYEHHHCVSVFVDIKGSTKLISKYSLLEVRLIKDTLLNLVIQVANEFGGHIHRLQGDAAFVQFVRRGRSANDAAINALNAMSLLSYFVSVDLAEIMKANGQIPLKIRVGIDYGDDQQVLWSYYGIPNCSELTVTSLHADMAAKLQQKAYDNAIIIGDNVRTLLDLRDDFLEYYQEEDSKHYVYTISRSLTYNFFVFNWTSYLLSFPFFKKDSYGKIVYKVGDFFVKCYIGDSLEVYYPNSYSLDKGTSLKFEIYNATGIYQVKPNDKIEWIVHNFGIEADSQENKVFTMQEFTNKNFCLQEAQFLGNHFMRCKLTRQYLVPVNIDFPIYVK